MIGLLRLFAVSCSVHSILLSGGSPSLGRSNEDVSDHSANESGISESESALLTFYEKLIFDVPLDGSWPVKSQDEHSQRILFGQALQKAKLMKNRQHTLRMSTYLLISLSATRITNI